jgi:uncharacterized protein
VSSVGSYPRPTYSYRTPGVYFEWLDRAPPLAEVRTDVAGFVGIAERGPLDEPVRVESWTQFTSTFGAHIAQGYLAYAVEGFFANGGRTCWVVRAADRTTAAKAAKATIDLYDDLGQPTLSLTAVNEGTWAHRILVSVSRLSESRFSLVLRLPDGAQEIWRYLTMAPGDPRYVVTMLGDRATGSRLVVPEDRHSPSAFPANTPSVAGRNLRGGTGRLGGGRDGLAALTPADLTGELDGVRGLASLEPIDEVSIVALPDAMPKLAVPPPPPAPRPPDCTIVDPEPEPPAAADEPPPESPPEFTPPQVFDCVDALVRHCARLKDRVAVLDSRATDLTPEDVSDWRAAFDSSYAALYFPWIRVPDPLRLSGLLRPVPPSGHVAGIYAGTDIRSGVHKPPANEQVAGAKAVVVEVGDVVHGDLNDQGVNVLRALPGRGIRLLGARTVSSDALFRYVNVRRLLLMIEKSIDHGIQWAVFEGNVEAVWRDVDRVVRSFLEALRRRGMLDGASAAESYLVRCDATTNPPEARDAGRMTCLVGVLPPWPAEFVVVRIGKTEGGTEIEERPRG